MEMGLQQVYAVMFDRDGFPVLARDTRLRVPDAQFLVHAQRSANKPLGRQRIGRWLSVETTKTGEMRVEQRVPGAIFVRRVVAGPGGWPGGSGAAKRNETSEGEGDEVGRPVCDYCEVQ